MSFNPGSASGAIHTDSDVALSNPADSQVLSYNASTSKWQNQTVTPTLATTSTPGIIQLAGDLTGSATAPTVAKLNGVAISGIPTANQVITAVSPTSAAWTTIAANGAQALTTTPIKTSAYNANAGDFVPADASSGSFVITLPTTQSDKTRISIKKVDSSTSIITVTAGASDVFNKTSGSTSVNLSVQNQSINLQYTSSSGIWYVLGEDLPLAQLDNRYSKQGSLFINVKEAPYSAKGDGTTDDTSAIQTALTAAYTAGGGTVFLPPGTYMHSGLTLNNFVILLGAGMHASILKLINGANANSITIYASPDGVIANAEFVSIRNLTIDGNGSNQTSTCHGIYENVNPSTTKATNDWDVDIHNYFENLLIYNAKTNGVYVTGRGECRYNNLQVYYAQHYAFYVAQTGAYFTNCTSGSSYNIGWYITAQSVRLANCKSFLSGQGASYVPTDIKGTGFYITAPGSVELTSCEAQDNWGAGFRLDGASRITLSACLADSNSHGSSGMFPGFDIYNSTYSTLNGVAWERAADGTHSYQLNALRLSNGSDVNDIILTHSAGTSPATVGPTTTSDTILLSNRVFINALPVNGASLTKWTSVKTAAYTAAVYDAVICNTTSNTFAVTLPAPTGTNGTIRVKWRTGSVAPTVVAAGGRTLDPNWSGFSQLGGSVTFSDDGTYWNVA